MKSKPKKSSSTRRPRKTRAGLKCTYKVYDSVDSLVNDAPIGVSGIDPAIFEKAAELVGNGEHEFCCRALNELDLVEDLGFGEGCHCQYFSLILNPHNGSFAWYSDTDYGGPTFKEITQRMMGLLLCAELVREGYVPKGFSCEQS